MPREVPDAPANRWLPAGLIVLGLALAIVSNFILLSDWYLLRTGVRAAATVIDGTPGGRSQAAQTRVTLGHPTLRFRTPAGQVVTFKPGSPGRRFYIGEIVTVVYRQAQPDKAMVAEYSAIWQTPLTFGLFAALLIGGGLLTQASRTRHRR